MHGVPLLSLPRGRAGSRPGHVINIMRSGFPARTSPPVSARGRRPAFPGRRAAGYPAGCRVPGQGDDGLGVSGWLAATGRVEAVAVGWPETVGRAEAVAVGGAGRRRAAGAAAGWPGRSWARPRGLPGRSGAGGGRRVGGWRSAIGTGVAARGRRGPLRGPGAAGRGRAWRAGRGPAGRSRATSLPGLRFPVPAPASRASAHSVPATAATRRRRRSRLPRSMISATSSAPPGSCSRSQRLAQGLGVQPGHGRSPPIGCGPVGCGPRRRRGRAAWPARGNWWT